MLFGGRKMKHKKQKKTKKAGRIAGCVCSGDRNAWRAAVYVRALDAENMAESEHGRACLPVKGPDCRNQP